MRQLHRNLGVSDYRSSTPRIEIRASIARGMSAAQPELAVVVSEAILPWDPRDSPILFAARYIEDLSYPPEVEHVGTLAWTFHSTIIIFILYYLDTRKSPSEPLPTWMATYGMVYSRQGTVLYRHFPTVSNVGGGSLQWGATAVCCSLEYNEVFRTTSAQRTHAMAMFYRLQSHMRLVLEKLCTWDGYKRAKQVLDG